MKKILTLVILLIFTTIINAQLPSEVWVKTFGIENTHQKINEIIELTDGYAIAGEQVINGYNTFWVAKLDFNGDTLWTRTRPADETWTVALGICQTSDNGFVAVGHITNTGLLVVKYDENGNFLWENIRNTQNQSEGHSIIEDINGDLVIAGYTMVGAIGYSDAWFVKYNSQGQFIKEKKYGKSGGYSFASGFKETKFGYVTSGYMPGDGNHDVFVYKLNYDLDTIKSIRIIANPGIENSYCVTPTNYDYGFVLTGRTATYGNGAMDIWVVKLDSLLNIEWTQTVGGQYNDTGYDIVQTSDNSFYLTGSITNNTNSHKELIVSKLNNLGEIVWEYVIESSLDEEGKSIIQNSQGNIIVAGFDCVNSNYNPQFWIAEYNIFDDINSKNDILFFDVDGELHNAVIDTLTNEIYLLVSEETDLTNIIPNITISRGATISPQGAQDFTEPFQYTVTSADNSDKIWTVYISKPISNNEYIDLSNLLVIYPNPTHDIVNLKFKNDVRYDKITIYDLNGVLLDKIETENISTLNFSNYNSGYYIIKVEIYKNTYTAKILKF